MALIPLSILFEIVLPVMALWFAEKGEFGRYIGICIWPIEISLLVLPFSFFSDIGGTLALVTIAFPTNIQGPIVLVIFLAWIWSMVDLYYFRQSLKSEINRPPPGEI
jgi:hypothetical protein